MELDTSRAGKWQGVLIAASIVMLANPLVAAAAEIRIGGTGNALGTMRLLAAAYAKSNAEATVVVLESIGTSGAIKAVPKGAIEIGLSSRPLTDEESSAGLSTSEYARSATVFSVQAKNPVVSLSTRQVADIYSGKMQQWPDGKPIRPVLRQPGDDNSKQVEALSPAIKQALLVAQKKPGMAFAVTDQESADKAESISGSFSITTLALILSEKRSLRALALDGVEPTPANLASGRYPMVKHFYFVLPKAPSPAELDFVKFVASPPGREILEKTGHLVP